MRLIAEACGRWPDPADEARVRVALTAFCAARRAGESTEQLLARLPVGARPAAEAVLLVLHGLQTRLGRRLNLVVDVLSLLDAGGSYVRQVGLGIGEAGVDRIDGYGATQADATAVASSLHALLEAFGPESATFFTVD
jgi:hypothetical protein